MSDVKYKRILIKLSGEALAAGADGILNHGFVRQVGGVIKKCIDEGSQVAIIIGAGNIWRGRQGTDMDRVTADHMGMLATTINSLGVADSFSHIGIDAKVLSSVEMDSFCEHYTPKRAREYLDMGKTVILAGGSGLPYFSTDTAAVLRAAEIEADMVLFAKNIDGIYTADPKKDPTAKKIDKITYTEMIEKDLKAIDATATVFSMENDISILCFGLADPENIYRAVKGENIGTLVCGK